ncbi:MAG: LacI family DNA-binding transcriptional regulator [Rhodospirillales bacterium]|nr:LacI family DNA-binding transcriptional regulator [Rhodospirillales bacterium]
MARNPQEDPKPARARRRAGRATMSDVARLAGVSAITVSRLLRDPASVSGTLAVRIRDAIERLGYVPNLMAGGLAAAKSRIVGVVVPSIRNAFFAASVDALSARFGERGYAVLDSSSDYDLRREDTLIEAMLAWNPAALVLTGFAHGPRAAAIVARAGVPIVEMWDVAGRPFDMAVGFDHNAAGRSVARHLLARGRRRVAVIGAMLGKDTRASARCAGVREELERAGRPAVATIDLPRASNVGDGASAFAEALAAPGGIDAAAFSNDVLALGAIFECQKRGVRIPDDVAIVGFGDLDFAAHCRPSLTTLRPPREQIGNETARLLLSRIDGQTPERPVVDLGCDLVVRESA